MVAVLSAADAPATDAVDPIGFLLSYGVLGLIFVLGIFGYIYLKPSVTDLKNQNKELRDDFGKQVVELRKDYTDQISALRRDHTEQITLMRVERDRANEQRDAMADTFQKEWIPALVKSLATVEALLPLMQRMVGRSGGDQQ